MLSSYLPSLKIDPVKQRLRCSGHIYNLMCKAILYGVDGDCLEDASQEATISQLTMTSVSSFEAVINGGSSDEAKLTAWRKKGPVGKLHNTVIHIKSSSSRRLLFESKQRQGGSTPEDEESDAMKIYRVVVNGGIRWNSTYLMIERAMLLKDALHLYQDDHHSETDAADYLTSEDWYQLADLLELLRPIYDASMRVQSRDTGLYEVLTSMDFILTHLESAKLKPTYTAAPYFKACVNLGWWKLDQYYTKTDLNPAYIMAVFLHPHYKMSWFKRHWCADEIKKARCYIDSQYLIAKAASTTTQQQPAMPVVSKDLNLYDAYNRLSSPTEDDEDDLQRYMSERIAPFATDPLQWWIDNGHLYPILKPMALTYLAAPPSSADNERLFSRAGNVVNEERPHTQATLAQGVQCLRSWHENDLPI